MLEITVQRRKGNNYPVIAEHHRVGSFLALRSEGFFALLAEPCSPTPRAYGTVLGQALFQAEIRDALKAAQADVSGSTRILLYVESEELRSWRWEWLCAPIDGGSWDFLSLNQQRPFSLYLPSLSGGIYPPIGLRDLRTLVVVANPSDPRLYVPSVVRRLAFDGASPKEACCWCCAFPRAVRLRGGAAETFLRFERELKPLGFHSIARALDFPGGFIGDIGLFLHLRPDDAWISDPMLDEAD